jgi:hypothetical protein
MNILTLLGQVFGPAAELVDNMHTSKEEKLQLKNGLMGIQANVVGQAIDLERDLLNAKRDIIVAEAKSDSWLTRNWRPITMLSLAASVMAYWFGLTPTDPLTGLSIIPLEVVNRMYSLVQIGVGGYIASRGVEKVAPGIIEAFKKKERT